MCTLKSLLYLLPLHFFISFPFSSGRLYLPEIKSSEILSFTVLSNLWDVVAVLWYVYSNQMSDKTIKAPSPRTDAVVLRWKRPFEKEDFSKHAFRTAPTSNYWHSAVGSHVKSPGLKVSLLKQAIWLPDKPFCSLPTFQKELTLPHRQMLLCPQLVG